MSTAECESSSCMTDTHDMPWAWILEYLVDVKEISPPFLQDIIKYVPHIEQPQYSRLVQKVASRFLERVTSSRELDTCDVVIIKFLLKEQGFLDVHSRIHSLKERFTHDLALRVQTEAVLQTLRSSGKEGRRDDWAAFEEALDAVFPKDTLEPREAERRNELTTALTDLFNGESSEDLRERLLGRYSLEELRRDLSRYLDDGKKLFEIKFLDQLAADVENGVYCPSPSRASPETRSPSGMHNDFCDKNQLQESLWTGNERSVRKATHHPSSDRPSISIPSKEGDLAGRADDQDHDCHHEASGVNASEATDARAELSSGIAEVDSIANGFADDGYELLNYIATFTEDISEPKFGRTVPTSSLVSPEKVAKRSVAEIFDQVPDVAKRRKSVAERRKADVEAVSEARKDRSIATDENVGIQSRSIVEEHLGEGPSKARVSSETDQSNKRARDHENLDTIYKRVEKSGMEDCPSRSPSGELNVPVAGDDEGVLHAKCCFCGNRGGCQALCHQCPASIHESCLSKLSIRQEKAENCWYCFACADSMAKERLREAEDAVMKYKGESLATEAKLEAFLSAQRELFREQPKEPNSFVELNKATFHGKVAATTSDAMQSLLHGGIGTARGSDAHSPNLAREVNDEEWPTSVPFFSQSSVIRERTCASRGNDVPRPELGGEVDDEEGPSLEAVPLPATLSPAPRDKHQLECCGSGQSGDPGSSNGRVGHEGTIGSAENNLHIIANGHDGVSKDVGAKDGSEVSTSHLRDAGPLVVPPCSQKIPEGEEADRHDSDVEEVCEGNAAAAEATNVAEKAAKPVSDKISTASNVEAKRRRRKVDRARDQIPGVLRQIIPWTRIEEEVLKEGVSMFTTRGLGGFKWSRI